MNNASQNNLPPDRLDQLIDLAVAGDSDALGELFGLYRTQLKRMLNIRMDGQLKGRVDPSDILQEAYLDLASRISEFKNKNLSFFVWLRLVTKERLLRTHRKHIEAKQRDARREVSFNQSPVGAASSICLAEHLIGQYTSVVGNVIKAEQKIRLQALLDEMQECDREIITLRLFECLTNDEAAEVLGLTKQTTSKRFIRAIGRIRSEVQLMPDFKGSQTS
jgi:RNA polymerase sigma-70 factor (ECF subfamily)